MKDNNKYYKLYFETIDGSYVTDQFIQTVYFLMHGEHIKNSMDMFTLYLRRQSTYRRINFEPDKKEEILKMVEDIDNEIHESLKPLIEFAESLKGIVKYEPNPDWKLPLQHGHLIIAEQVYADLNECTLSEAREVVSSYIKNSYVIPRPKNK